MQVVCTTCGRTDEAAEGGGPPLGWSTGTAPGGREELTCPECAREHIRAIEAKLPGEYW